MSPLVNVRNAARLGVVASAVAFASSSYAIGSGFIGVPTLSGGASTELHSVTWRVPNTPPFCEATCSGAGAGNGEAAMYTAVSNKTATTSPGTPVVPPKTVDTYQSTTAGGADALSLVVMKSFEYHSPSNPLAGLQNELGPVTTTEGFDFTTDGQGMITDGWVLTLTPFGGANFLILQDYNGDGSVEIGGWIGDPAVLIANVATLRADPTTAVAGLVHAGIAEEVSYNVCNPSNCGGSAKAVPVPAFAAATLGLGLVGVTVMTARRRKIAK